MAIVLRLIKGSKLTHAELDGNFTHILNETLSKSGLSNNQVYIKNSSGVLTPISIGEDEVLGRLSGGEIKGLSVAEQKELVGALWDKIGVQAGAIAADLTVGDEQAVFTMPYQMTVTKVIASVLEASVGSSIIVDITKSGASIFSTLLSIDASETSSITAAVPAVISDNTLADGAKISINIDQVGSTNAGKELTVWIIGERVL